MLNLIDPQDIGKCVNLIYSHKKPLLKCIEEQLWIYHLQRWWSPYEFALEYGRCWLMVFDENTIMKNPYHILKSDSDFTDAANESEAKERWEVFKNKVDAYYIEGWDSRLKASIETNRWV